MKVEGVRFSSVSVTPSKAAGREPGMAAALDAKAMPTIRREHNFIAKK